MGILETLLKLEDRLWNLKMRRSKKVYLSCKEIQELMRKDAPIPTNIFNAERKEYIVKARTIYGSEKRR